jgi:hypothetical protein
VQSHFWDDPKNRRRYMDWLGKKLGYHRPADWLKVTHDDFAKNNGERLLLRYNAYLELLAEYLPQLIGGPKRYAARGRSVCWAEVGDRAIYCNSTVTTR